jgi:hypothetical protein
MLHELHRQNSLTTPLLALLVLPLVVFTVSHVMLLCFTCLHDFSAKQGLAALPCPLHVALMKVVGRASRDASWCMHDLFN